MGGGKDTESHVGLDCSLRKHAQRDAPSCAGIRYWRISYRGGFAACVPARQKCSESAGRIRHVDLVDGPDNGNAERAEPRLDRGLREVFGDELFVRRSSPLRRTVWSFMPRQGSMPTPSPTCRHASAGGCCEFSPAAWPAVRRRRTRNGAMGTWRWLFGRRLAATLPRGVDRSDRRPDSAAEHPPPPLLRRASAVGCSREISAAALNGRTWPTAANVPSVKQTLWLKSAIRMSVGPLSTQSGLSRVTS